VEVADAGEVRRQAAPVLVVGAILFAPGCAHDVRLASRVEVAHVHTIPVAMGVYHPPELRADTRVVRHYSGHSYRFPVGAASVSAFEAAATSLFATVRPVETNAALSRPPEGLAGVLALSIEDFAIDLPALNTGSYAAEIVYRVRLVDARGENVATWRVRGAGHRGGDFDITQIGLRPGPVVDLAIHDAMRQFVTGFRGLPEVERWLATQR
jgi:hypothetical protein